MDVGGNRYGMVGGVHRIPVRDLPGALHLCGLDPIGTDPVVLLDHIGARTVVCLQTDAEIERRFPAYLDWLADPGEYEVVRVPIEDHLVAPDASMEALVRSTVARLRGGTGVVVHCGAGWGRAGLLAALIMTANGTGVEDTLRDLRAARPAAGPQSTEQRDQLDRLAPGLADRVAVE